MHTHTRSCIGSHCPQHLLHPSTLLRAAAVPLSGIRTTHLLLAAAASICRKWRQVLDETQPPLQPLRVKVSQHGQQLRWILIDLADLVLRSTRDTIDPGTSW